MALSVTQLNAAIAAALVPINARLATLEKKVNALPLNLPPSTGVIATPPAAAPARPLNSFLGPFLTSAQITSAGGSTATWKSMFDTFEPGEYTRAAGWTIPYDEVHSNEMGAVYDRPMMLEVFAEGDSTNAAALRAKAVNLITSYRDNYLAPDWPNEPNWQPMSLAAHYIRTSDATSLANLGWLGTYIAYYQGTGHFAVNSGLFGGLSMRWMSKAIETALACKRTNAAKTQKPSTSIPAYSGTWDDLCTGLLNDILSIQDADGGWRPDAYDNGVSAFQTGMLCSTLRVYYTYFSADSRIPTAVKKALNFVWEHLLGADGETFAYSEFFDTNVVNGTINWSEDTDDVNGWFLDGLYWMYYLTGDTTYRARADVLLTRMISTGDGLTGAFLASPSQSYKQLSEWVRAAMAGMYYRAQTPLTSTTVINSVAPSISGLGTGSLTRSVGTWSGSPTFTYQWLKRTATGVWQAAGTGTTLSESGLSGYRIWFLEIPSGDGIPARSNLVTVA